MTVRYGTSATTTRLLIAIPQGPLVMGRVKEITGVETFPTEAHPGASHTWREMDHYGEYGTGFAMCLCGAIGEMYDHPYDAEDAA